MPLEEQNNQLFRGNNINGLDRRLLKSLLVDRTTKKNIIWATEDYETLGDKYKPSCRIMPELITGERANVIVPRVLKAYDQKKDRTRQRAEVFTPAWVCNEQNNLIDMEWFGGKYVFNEPTEKGWTTIKTQVPFPKKGSKTWKKYVDCRRLEITCGEAPYLVSRYDSVTGITIPVQDRIGLLDRKLRVVDENNTSEEEWKKWARRAVESIYGYEYQGDSLFLARENVLYTYIEHYNLMFGKEPDFKELQGIVLVVSWNLFQMDGFSYSIPHWRKYDDSGQMSFFDLFPDLVPPIPAGDEVVQCKIRDWRSRKTILFKELMGGESQ